MKRIILLLTTITTISLTQAQPQVKIDTDKLQAEISKVLATLPVDLNDLNIDLGEMAVNVAQSNVKVEVNDSNSTGNYVYAYTNNEPVSEYNYNYSYTTTETSQNSDVFNQLSNLKGIEVVYISKAMLGMMPNMDMPGVDIGNIAGKLESLEIYTSEDDNTTKRLKEVSSKLLSSGNYETLMLTKDSDSKTGFYMKKDKSNKGSEMLMVTEDGSEATIIRFLGSFTLQDIQNLTNQGKGTNTPSRSNYISDAELERRLKEAEKISQEAQKIAADAQKQAEKAQQEADRLVREAQKKADAQAKEQQKKAQ